MEALKEIEKDLRAFADPGSEVAVDQGSAIFERNGREIVLKFSAPPSGHLPDVIVGQSRMSYKQFLASDLMADLKTFADFIVKTSKKSYDYLETSARLSDDAETGTKVVAAAEAVTNRATKDLPYLSTLVTLVRGEAGSGKTVTLREVTTRRAIAYREGKVDSLFFFIDAQGRALSRLEDAMAKDLQDLRSRFSYAAMGPLTRHGLIVPIIDGFDELLGSGGYDEAFSSLAAFLATLDGQGSVIASARSAFFDYKNFYENAKRYAGEGSLNYVVETVNILSWSDDQVREYFRRFAGTRGLESAELLSKLESMRSAMTPANKELLSKPFYASLVASLLSENQEINNDDDLLDQLVDSFIDREHRKLLDKEGKPLLSAKGHRAFLTNLAEEMWWLENRRIDVGTVQVVAELVTEQFGLPPSAANSIVERVSSYAFLTSDSSAKRFLRFEHEVFYGYFLAHKLQQLIERDPSNLRRFLGRSVIDETIVDQAVQLIGNDIERSTRAVESVSGSLRANLSDSLARENAGVVVAAIIKSVGQLRVAASIRSVIFRKVGFGACQLHRTKFENCDFDDVDLTGAVISDPELVNTVLRSVAVDLNHTRIDSTDPKVLECVYGLTVVGELPGVPNGKVFDPSDIKKVLRTIGLVLPQHAEEGKKVDTRFQKKVELVDRFVRRMERRFYVTEADVRAFNFAKDSQWSAVWEALFAHGLLEKLIVPKAGRREPLVRLTVPPELLRRGQAINDPRVPESVKSFWKELRS